MQVSKNNQKRGAPPTETFTLTAALIANETIDPMIGMEGVTPQMMKRSD